MGPYSYSTNKGETLLFSFYEAFFRPEKPDHRNGLHERLQLQRPGTRLTARIASSLPGITKSQHRPDRVSINDSGYRDTRLFCFFDNDMLMVSVDYEQRVWQAAHIFDTAGLFSSLSSSRCASALLS